MESKQVILKEINGKDVLEFSITGEEKLYIDINNKDQTSLRQLFYRIIEEAIKQPFNFQLVIEEGYNKALYSDVSTEYIKQLNLELNKILEDVPAELK